MLYKTDSKAQFPRPGFNFPGVRLMPCLLELEIARISINLVSSFSSILGSFLAIVLPLKSFWGFSSTDASLIFSSFSIQIAVLLFSWCWFWASTVSSSDASSCFIFLVGFPFVISSIITCLKFWMSSEEKSNFFPSKIAFANANINIPQLWQSFCSGRLGGIRTFKEISGEKCHTLSKSGRR